MSQTSWKPLSKGTVAGGLVSFLAHGLGWSVLPFTNRAIHDFNAPERLAVLSAGASAQPGTYFVNADAARSGLAVPEGVYGWMTLHPASGYAQTGSLGWGLLINLAMALLVSWLVLRSSATSFGGRFVIGLAATAFALLAGPIWDLAWAWYSAPYAVAVGLNVLLGGLGSAAVIAWLVKPAPRAALGADVSAAVPAT